MQIAQFVRGSCYFIAGQQRLFIEHLDEMEEHKLLYVMLTINEKKNEKKLPSNKGVTAMQSVST